MFTRTGVERIHRFAFSLARTRPRKHLTLVTKSNAQRFGMVMWDEIFFEVAKDYPDVKTDRELVDAMTTRMVLKPHTLDVMVATNLHADILSDLAAALAGSLGIAPTANLNPERKFPSMFEPIHGSAFDITGKGVANPVATFWTVSMMLDHLGEHDASRRLMNAIERVTAEGILTPDLGGNAKTIDVTKAVRKAILDGGEVRHAAALAAHASELRRRNDAMTLKRPGWGAGTLVVLEHDSKILRDNPLGDPHVRKLHVWLPPQYNEGPRAARAGASRCSTTWWASWARARRTPRGRRSPRTFPSAPRA